MYAYLGTVLFYVMCLVLDSEFRRYSKKRGWITGGRWQMAAGGLQLPSLNLDAGELSACMRCAL